jgi:Flp pilus assembly protein TadG
VRSRRWRDESGQELAVEIMLLLPVVLGLVLATAWAGRYTTSRSRLADVAGAAARAASLAPDESSGRLAAQRLVSGSALPTSCDDITTTIEVRPPEGGRGAWRGGAVTVTLACTVRNTVLAGVWVPGTSRLRGTSTHPVDAFRVT